jgi:hypothetical protein
MVMIPLADLIEVSSILKDLDIPKTLSVSLSEREIEILEHARVLARWNPRLNEQAGNFYDLFMKLEGAMLRTGGDP